MKRLIATGLAIIMASMPVLASDGIKVFSNGNEVADKGIIVEGRTLVPVRGVFEYMGYTVDWDAVTKTASLKSDDTTVTIKAGEKTFTVNNKEITPDVPQQIVKGRFMLPLRAVGEAADCEVDWDAVTKTAYISDEAITDNDTDDNKDDKDIKDNNSDSNTSVESSTEATTAEKTEVVTNEDGLIDNGNGVFTAPGVSISFVDEAEIGDATDINID